jgi:M6 family metalloprotease-like protein
MKLRNKIITFLPIILLLLAVWQPVSFLSATNLSSETGRLELAKDYPLRRDSVTGIRRIHPAESYFRSGREIREPSRTKNFDRILVLLVDFQEDDNPLTTGSGKFILEPDENYPVSLGAPPRDYQYFETNLEAMRYYYLAASLGNYDLQYDIYPLENDAKFAYTLPQEMGYYNPGLSDYDLFIERIEEYFQDIFTVADSYNEIDFGQYGHYVIIHAGSDWQHDVYGDTPSDLPSFFIQIGEGKEVWVNNGTVKITNACNVPETISQDGRYGLINAVLAHEFGHSLGFVDLYNVNNFYPGVGYWDLMDSGGTGRLVTMGDDGELYAIEGGLPTLPNAWHRLLVWEDEFQDMGVYHEINDFPFGSAISLSAASRLYDQDNPLPYFVKVPLNSSEYLLLENRHVDPDGDGGIAFKGAVPLTPGSTDYRVLLYPTAVYDDDLKPVYEYDWLLPGWMNERGESFGGGIIVWHIDEKIIYDEGVIDSEGNFRSNYENNSVNTDFRRRGIRIVEADNINDIGNPYSWFWNGTEYEPFFWYKPQLDEDGFFLGWSAVEFNRSLSANSKPPLLTNSGYPSLYKIFDISSSSGVMSFKYAFEPFENTGVLSSDKEISYLAPPGRSSFLAAATELPVFSNSGVRFLRHYYEPANQIDEWSDLFGEHSFAYTPTQPVISLERAGYPTNYYISSDEQLIRISEDVGSFQYKTIVFEEEIVESPLLIENEEDLLLLIPTADKVIIWSELDEKIIEILPVENARICFDGTAITAVSNNQIYQIPLDVIQPDTGSGKRSLKNERESGNYSSYLINKDLLAVEFSSDYYPVAYVDQSNPSHNAQFIQAVNGDIYKLRNSATTQIFNLEQYTREEPTQLALANIEEKVLLFFAAGEYLFALDIYGNLAQGFPRHLEKNTFSAAGDIRIFGIDGGVFLVLPVEDEGYLLYNYENGIERDLSIVWNKPGFPDHFYWEKESERLYFFFADKENYLYESVFATVESDPLLWNGYRNSGWSLYQGVHRIETASDDLVTAYAFPNPALQGEVRIRVEGASEQIELQIYDITGKRLFSRTYQDNIGATHDLLWNTKGLATGIYFGVVKTNGRTADFKVAIEK